MFITFYFHPYTYNENCDGDIALKKKCKYSLPEAYEKVKEEFESIILLKLKNAPTMITQFTRTEELIRFSFDGIYKNFLQSWISFFVRELMGQYKGYRCDNGLKYQWDNFNNAFYGAKYFEETIPLISCAEICFENRNDMIHFELLKSSERIIVDRHYLEGKQKLAKCSFKKIKKDLIARNIPDSEIKDYEDACTESLDKVVYRCPNCGCDRWEGRRTDRVYFGSVGNDIDIVEDPHEDGELEDEMFCSKCGIELDRFNY